MDPDRLHTRLVVALGFVANLLYASAFFLASAVVVALAGAGGTAVGGIAMTIATVVGTLTAARLTVPVLDRVVAAVLATKPDAPSSDAPVG